MPSQKPLLLEVGTAYLAGDFDSFDYSRAEPPETGATLHLHLKNGSRVDLPASAESLKFLLGVLMDAFPEQTVEHVVSRRWAVKP